MAKLNSGTRIYGTATVDTTLAAGNTTITGFANVSVSVNSALLTVGTSFIANTTGAFHTGTINAASHTTSGFVANTTAIAPTSNTILLGNSIGRFVLSANTGDFTGTVTGTVANMSTSVNSALLTVGTSFIANTTGAFHTGLVNAASHTTSGFVANTTAIAPTSNTILLGNSIGRFVLSANTGDFTGTVTGTVANMSTSVNSALLTVGTSFIANTTGAFHTGIINAASFTTTGFVANTTVIAPTSNTILLGNSIGRFVLSANTGDFTGTVTGTVANMSTSVNSALLTVGTSFIANTTGAFHTGIINAASFTTTGFIANTTVIAPTSNTVLLGNSIGRFVISANTINTSGLITASAGANISGTANLVDVNISGNLTVSGTTTYVNTTNLNVGDNIVVLNADLTNVTAPTENAGLEVNRGSSANVSFLWNETSDSWTLGNTNITGYSNVSVSVNSALLTVGTSFIANSTAIVGTGYANISTSVNSALLTVGSSFIANTTGVYHTGTVNAASITIGSSSFIANSTAIVIADPLTANGTTGTAGQVLTSNGATGAPYWDDSAGGGVARTVTSYSGNGSNTVYGVSYTAGLLDVYLNGIRLILGSDFTATNGTDVTFTTAPSNGDNIDLISYSQTLIAPVNARTVTNYTANGSTSTFNVTYDVGYLDVFVNGIKLSSGVDYTATSGSNVIFSTNPLNGDYLELVSYTVAPLQGDGSIRTVTYYTGDGSTTNYGINYDNGYLDVYVNGIKYKFGADYTASNGTGVSILSAPLIGDNIELVAYHNDATLLDVVLKAGDTMTGALTVPVLTSSGNVSGVNGYFTTINAASHTIGSTLIANTSGVYHTGTINASSITIGSSSFVANSTAVVISDPLTANGATGTAGHILTSNGTIGSPYWAPALVTVPNANTRVSSLGVGVVASGTTGEIRATDAITAYFSDKRLKENVRPIENAVEKVKLISGVTFISNQIAEQYGYKNKNTQVGVIAQELELVLPQVVTAAPFDIGQREDGTEYSLSGENYKTVYYEKIVPLLIEAIKEQQKKIEKLESSIDQLSKRI